MFKSGLLWNSSLHLTLMFLPTMILLLPSQHGPTSQWRFSPFPSISTSCTFSLTHQRFSESVLYGRQHARSWRCSWEVTIPFSQAASTGGGKMGKHGITIHNVWVMLCGRWAQGAEELIGTWPLAQPRWAEQPSLWCSPDSSVKTD